MSNETHRVSHWLYAAKMMPKLDPDTAEPLFDEKPFIKIGVTTAATVDTRLNQFSVVYDSIKIVDVDTEKFRVIEELLIAKYKKGYGYTPKFKFGGSTECYRMDFLPTVLNIFKKAKRHELCEKLFKQFEPEAVDAFENVELLNQHLLEWEKSHVNNLRARIEAKDVLTKAHQESEPIDDL